MGLIHYISRRTDCDNEDATTTRPPVIKAVTIANIFFILFQSPTLI